MSRHPSHAFRLWCAGLIVLVFSSSLPATAWGKVAPIDLVKFQLKKPNFLIVVESAESMQGLPGENPARYNEVGVDCEKGDRFCRLYGQAGRCEFSGMGQQGYVFDEVPMGTSTGTATKTGGTKIITSSATGTLSANITGIVSSTSTNPAATTVAATTTGTFSLSALGTATETRATTETRTVTTTNTGVTAQTSSYMGTTTATGTTTSTSSASAATTNTGNTTSTVSYSGSTTNTGTASPTSSYSGATTNTGTTTPTSSYSGSTTNTMTAMPTSSYSGSTTNTQTALPTSSYSGSTTNTQTLNSTNSKSAVTTNTGTVTPTSSYSGSTTNTATVAPTSSANTTSTGSKNNTTTASYTRQSTATMTMTGTNTWTLMPGGNERGLWRFEGSGTSIAADAWGNYNGTSVSVTTGAGRFGNAVQLNSGTTTSATATKYIYLPSSTPSPTTGGDFAIGFWAYLNQPTRYQTIVSYEGSGHTGDGAGYGLRIGWNSSSGGNYFSIDNNSNTLQVASNGQTPNSGWNYFLLTIVGSTNLWTIRIYDNNCGSSPKSFSGTIAANFTSGGTWRFGAGPGNTNQFLGLLDEVRIWDSLWADPTTSGLNACKSSQEGNVMKVWTAVNATAYTTSSAYNTFSKWATDTASASWLQWSTQYLTSSSAQYNTSTASASTSQWSTATSSASSSQWSTTTQSASSSQNSTATLTGSSSQWATTTLTGSSSRWQTSTLTGSQTAYTTGTSAGTLSANNTTTLTASETNNLTGLASVSTTATGTMTESGTTPAVSSYSDITSNTETLIGTQSLTATATTTLAVHPVPDTDDCNNFTSCGGASTCYMQKTKGCSSNSECTVSGDFCQRVALNDGTNRIRGDSCVASNPASNICRYQAKSCIGDSACNASTVGLDYCVTGASAQMCQKTGLWCSVADTGVQCSSSDDKCGPATSRMMMVKNAVRRVFLDHAYDDSAVVKIGQMHTYQANKLGSTENLFPYVKLAEPTLNRSEIKFLPRSELLRGTYNSGACFSESTGPTGSCVIDYGGGGASTTPSVTYTLVTDADLNDSRYAIPTGDGKTFVHEPGKWGTCGLSCSFPSASIAGKGLYEGSYYRFTYRSGVPIDAGSDPNNPVLGSLKNPQYYSTYQGKSFGSVNSYWMLMDAERSDIVNENKYGALDFSGASWSTSAEYALPYRGASGDPLSTSVDCSASNGAQWDHNVVPMVNATTFASQSVTPTEKALLNVARLEKNSFGGFHAVGNIAPVACALKNDGSNDSQHSVEGYMTAVKSADGSVCWENHVLLVVDGLPRGPGDVAIGGIDCSAAACKYDTNPTLSGCTCPAVTKARSLAASGINVHVIAATTNPLAVNPYAAMTLNNIAIAGSTSTGFINQPRYAASEDELYFWLNYEMKEGLRVRVATTPASAASGSQSLSGVTAGNMLFQTVAELPEWRGSLYGYQIAASGGTSTSTGTGTSTSTSVTYSTSRKWDAAKKNGWVPCLPASDSYCTEPNDTDWKKRYVFFSDGSGEVRKIGVDLSTGAVDGDSKSALLTLGMGANENEAERIVQWMLGKIDDSDTSHPRRPLNPAVMGSVVNSMPISVGPPGVSMQLGGRHFYYTHVNRTELVYVGADDGMLHAFRASDGQEAFAFIPADMVPVIAKLYAQGGQRYNPNEHIYGLSGSPKVKNLCVANCNPTNPDVCSDVEGGSYNVGACPVWKTILIMGEGQGGHHPFALDITDPMPSGTPNLEDSVLWHVGYKPGSALDTGELGDTMSVAAFAYKKTTDMSDNRVLMASSYPAGSHMYTKLLDAKLLDGSNSGSSGLTIWAGSCSQPLGMVADVALARDYTAGGEQSLIAAYLADTHGRINQYSPFYSSTSSLVKSFGCEHPLHFSPAVIQLNRNDSANLNGAFIFLAQVTNSLLDVDTRNSSTPSQLAILKLTSIGNSPPALDATFGSSGAIRLDTGCTGTNCLCGKLEGIKSSTSTTDACGTGGYAIPVTARPTGTPMAVLRTDGQGFQLYTTWYSPPASNWDNCANSDSNGTSYITVHEFLSNGTWAQIVGIPLQRQYVTGVQFVGTTLFVTYGMNEKAPGPPDGWPNLGQTFETLSKNRLQTMASDRFVRTAWAERLDL